MEKWIGRILLDVAPPERPKFKAPLILAHGLWTSGRCWRAWATHFSNLGWECWSVNFRGRFGPDAFEALKRLTVQDCVDDLRQVIRAADFPPVLLAHDLGGPIAARAAAEESLSGLILLASLPPKEIMPEPPRALRLMRLKYAPLLFLGRPFALDEKDFRKNWLNALPPADHVAALGALVPDSPDLIRRFFARDAAPVAGAARAPALVVAAGEDRLAPAEPLRALAGRIGADFRDYPEHGHWIIGASGGQAIVRDIHRWIVKKSGEEILLGEEKPE